MENPWIKRHLRDKLYSMPTTMNEDRELEFEDIPGRQILDLIRYWTENQRRGSITIQEHRAIVAVILYQFDSQATT